MSAKEATQQLAAKPFLKWAGGKAQILGEIREKYPAGLGCTIKKYAEPFVGGGAVLFDVLSNYKLSEVYISDINRELIQTYLCIRNSIDDLIEVLHHLEQEYLSAGEDGRREIYYRNRDRFNQLKSMESKSPELAALFIVLNRTCFNGLYRVNRRGEYNVPMGNYRNPTICDAANLRAVSRCLQAAKIVCGEYKASAGFIDKHTFAYFDPPYRPLSATSSFTSYAQDGFDDTAQAELAAFIDALSDSGAYVVASNSDPRNTNPDDDFFDALYARHQIHRISASRMINSVSTGRGKISELLIVNNVRGHSMRDFTQWFSGFKSSIVDYTFYTDFAKVHRHVDSIATGVEAGLDSNGRKNRGGHLMENLVETYLQKAGLEKNVTYFKEMGIADIESRWSVDLSALSHGGKTVKRFDFVVPTPQTIYGIETNFYSGGGSKLNETARSYKTIALEARNVDRFAFAWFTDGKGWASARHNLEETFDVMEHIYNINDLENDVIGRIFR